MTKTAADRVARHLVAAGRLVDEDPEAALEQARAARAIGARVAVVREAVGETAYAAGEWAEAIAELRAARRMTGNDSTLPMIADSERALGRPDRALRIAQSEEARALAPPDRAEMRIVEAGARRDLDQLDAALLTLQDVGLDRRAPQPWSARVWYAYADLLLAAGREDEARDWFLAAAGLDRDAVTDADERVLELEGIEVLAEEEDADEGGADESGADESGADESGAVSEAALGGEVVPDEGGAVVPDEALVDNGSADALAGDAAPGGGPASGTPHPDVLAEDPEDPAAAGDSAGSRTGPSGQDDTRPDQAAGDAAGGASRPGGGIAHPEASGGDDRG